MYNPIALPGNIVALAARGGPDGAGAEVSLICVHDGRIGDPVTWAGQAGAESRAAFAAVADDIRAHLGDGVVAVHGTGAALALITAILPGWRPTAVLDTRVLLWQARREGAHIDLGPARIERDHSTAARARATAALLVLVCETAVRGA